MCEQSVNSFILSTEEMIRGLQRLGWKKVDVSFHSAFWPFFAHNNIHVPTLFHFHLELKLLCFSVICSFCWWCRWKMNGFTMLVPAWLLMLQTVSGNRNHPHSLPLAYSHFAEIGCIINEQDFWLISNGNGRKENILLLIIIFSLTSHQMVAGIWKL